MKNKKYDYLFEYPEFETMKEIIEYTTEKYPNHNAYIIKEKNEKEVNYKYITFKQVQEDIKNLGTGFFDLGLKDKKVAIISKNRYEWIMSFMTLLYGGIIAVPLDKGLTEIEIENSLNKVKPDAIIFDNGTLDSIKNLKDKVDIKHYISMDESEEFDTVYKIIENGKILRAKGNTQYEEAKVSPDQISELCFTSGTSANSKIVQLSQKNVATNICAMHATEDIRDTDVNLAFLPMHHTFGSTGDLFVYSCGTATAFPDGLRYIAQNLKEYGVSVFIGVPVLVEAMYHKIEKELEKKNKTKIVAIARKITNLVPSVKRKVFKEIIDSLGGKLRLIISGAAGLDKDVWKAFNEFGIQIVQGYGLTEASPVVAAENAKYGKQGSIGFPLKGVEVKIINKNELGMGELVAKGPNVMMGYYEDEEATKETITEDGWLLTGDIAYIDKEGFIFITGRKKNVIVLKNGKNIYPEELEMLINKIPLVKESMVFGMPKDDDLVVSVKVQYDQEYVNANHKGISQEELNKMVWEEIKEVNKTLPTYKYIKNMILTNEDFIKTTTAKIKRYEEMKKINCN